jgi:hypothetical protein
MNQIVRRSAIAAAAAAAVVGGIVGGVDQAAADPDWSNLRLLTCDEGPVETFLTPAGFGTPFHVVGSSDVIVPKHSVAVLPSGSVVVAIDVPGFDPSRSDAVHCTYTDPAGVFVTFEGIRT